MSSILGGQYNRELYTKLTANRKRCMAGNPQTAELSEFLPIQAQVWQLTFFGYGGALYRSFGPLGSDILIAAGIKSLVRMAMPRRLSCLSCRRHYMPDEAAEIL